VILLNVPRAEENILNLLRCLSEMVKIPGILGE
jgi:hypothetical protein